MISLFDLATVKSHLRIDHDLEDGLILAYMGAAKDFCETFIGKSLADYVELPGTVLAGLLVHTALLFESREGEFMEKNLQTVRLLYWPHRVMS